MKAIQKRKHNVAALFSTTYTMPLTVLMRNGRTRWRLRHALCTLCRY
ncbi:hypothetical protein APED_09110 [Acanthopleuribacter pedis]